MECGTLADKAERDYRRRLMTVVEPVIVGISEDSDLARDLKARYPDVEFVFDPIHYNIVGIKSYNRHEV